MESSSCYIVLLLLIASGIVVVHAHLTEDDFQHCKRVVHNWATSQLNQEVREDKHTLRDFLFFLHIPRTGGRTYFHCFLKKLYSSECPGSYDKLRFNPRKANCRLLVTHDDYSMMSKLPMDKTSVVTILRNPVDRVFSTYEFSIEVAARFLVHSNLSSIAQYARRLRKKSNGVSTLDIWPWKYLVPWMREDLFARRDAKLHRKTNITKDTDSYNMEEMAMPLHQYINHPVAMDIVHNGATFQVAGLTNNSYLAESHEVRLCVQKYHLLGDFVLDVAKRRLDNMLYVGLTEDHKGSATTFAHVVGAQVISQLVESNSSMENLAKNISEQSSILDVEPDNDLKSSLLYHNTRGRLSPEVVKNADESMSVGKLMDNYEVCISSLRKTQARRRTYSLTKIFPVNFSKEARLEVPDSVINQIMSLNRLDMELYSYAQDIFARQHERTFQKLDGQNDFLQSYYNASSWKNILLAMAIVLVVLGVCIFVNARRRTSKVKV